MGILNNMKPEKLRPIKGWSSLTEEEQNALLDEFMEIPIVEFNDMKLPSQKKAMMMLSLRDLTSTVFLKDKKKAAVHVDADSPILKEPVEIKVNQLIEAVHRSLMKSELISQIMSAHGQKILMHHVYKVEPDKIEWDMVRERAAQEYEDFMKLNEDKIKDENGQMKFYEFLFGHANM